MIVDESENKPREDLARHLTFQLELVFINRIIKKPVKEMLSPMLSFDGHPRDKKQGKKAPSANPRIQDCLDVFRRPEQLDEENTWYCNKCKDHVQATKTIEIFKAPPIMVLCLQRFKSHNIYFKDKLDD